MFFLGSLSIQCKIRCNQPSDTGRSTCWPPLVYFSVCISFWLEFEHSTSTFMQSPCAERQFEFVVFVSCIVLLYFMLWSTPSVTNYIFFILSIDWMLELFWN